MKKETEDLILYGDAGIVSVIEADIISQKIRQSDIRRSDLLSMLENLSTGTLYKQDDIDKPVEWIKGAVLRLWKRAFILEQFCHIAIVRGRLKGETFTAKVWGERGECTVYQGDELLTGNSIIASYLYSWRIGGKWRVGCPMWHMERAFAPFGDFQKWWERNSYNVISAINAYFQPRGVWRFPLPVRSKDSSLLTVRGMDFLIRIRDDEQETYGLRECLEVYIDNFRFDKYFTVKDGNFILKDPSLKRPFEENLARSLPDENERRDFGLCVAQQVLKVGRDYCKPWLLGPGGDGKSFIIEHLELLHGLFERKSGGVTFANTGYNAAGTLSKVKARCILCDDMLTGKGKFNEQVFKDVLNGGTTEEIVLKIGTVGYKADFGEVFSANGLPLFQSRKACLDRLHIFKFSPVDEKIRRETKAKHLLKNHSYIAGFAAWMFEYIARVQQGEEPRVQTMEEKEAIYAEYGEASGIDDISDISCPPELINLADSMKEGEFITQAELSSVVNIAAAQRASWLAVNKKGISSRSLLVRTKKQGVIGYKRTANAVPADIEIDIDEGNGTLRREWRVFLASDSAAQAVKDPYALHKDEVSRLVSLFAFNRDDDGGNYPKYWEALHISQLLESEQPLTLDKLGGAADA